MRAVTNFWSYLHGAAATLYVSTVGLSYQGVSWPRHSDCLFEKVDVAESGSSARWVNDCTVRRQRFRGTTQVPAFTPRGHPSFSLYRIDEVEKTDFFGVS